MPKNACREAPCGAMVMPCPVLQDGSNDREIRHASIRASGIIQEESMSGLGDFHHSEEAPAKSSKIASWAIIALIVGGIAAYVVESGMLSPQPAQTAKTYPRGL